MPCRQRPAGGFVAVVTKQIEAGRALADIYPARFCTLCRKEDAMSKQRIQLSDHFTYSRLLRFVLPCIGTMLFTSIYGIVDGLCVSNFVGKTAFAAVNLIMPLPMLLGTIGFMLGTGGSAIVGITLGEGDQKKADRYFTLFLLAALVSVSVLAVLGIVFLRPIAVLLGAKGELLDYAVRYGRILMVSLPTFAFIVCDVFVGDFFPCAGCRFFYFESIFGIFFSATVQPSNIRPSIDPVGRYFGFRWYDI
mgnify:CR=1 FL=1